MAINPMGPPSGPSNDPNGHIQNALNNGEIPNHVQDPLQALIARVDAQAEELKLLKEDNKVLKEDNKVLKENDQKIIEQISGKTLVREAVKGAFIGAVVYTVCNNLFFSSTSSEGSVRSLPRLPSFDTLKRDFGRGALVGGLVTTTKHVSESWNNGKQFEDR